MDEHEFWSFVEGIGDDESIADERIKAMDSLKVLWVDYWQAELWSRAGTWLLFDFLAIAYEDCFGDESFDSYRKWLVYQGEKIYTDALRNPDSLVDVMRDIEGYMMAGEGGPFWIVSDYAILIADKYSASFRQGQLPPELQFREIQGEEGDADDDEQVKRLYPRGYQEYRIEGKVKI